MEDVFNSLLWQKTKSSAKVRETSYQYFKYSRETKFDVIFAWDLFNYCQPQEITAIGQLLTQHCGPTTRIYLMSYTHPEIPAGSCQFSLTENNRIIVTKARQTTHRRHNLTAAGLTKLLPSFYVNTIHAFQPGMLPGTCEYVLEYREDVSANVREGRVQTPTGAVGTVRASSS